MNQACVLETFICSTHLIYVLPEAERAEETEGGGAGEGLKETMVSPWTKDRRVTRSLLLISKLWIERV
jgi:hypothetical protein